MVTTNSSGWNGIYGMHRADLLNVLAASLPPGTIRTGHRCIGFEQDGFAARLKFANGETAEADIVIAADGIHSVLQKYVVEPKPPEYSGVRAYRGLIPREKLAGWPEAVQQIWMGDGKHFMVYPVRGGRLLNYVGFVPERECDGRVLVRRRRSRRTCVVLRRMGSAASSGCLKRWRAAFGGACMIACRCNHGPRDGLFCWVTPPMRCFRISARAPTRRSKTGSLWQYFSRGGTRLKCPKSCRNTKNYVVLEPISIQAEARKNGLRYDSKYANLEQRDREIANAGAFRRSLFDYDVEKAAIAHLSESRCSPV